jgi:RHS repeat-associated protein
VLKSATYPYNTNIGKDFFVRNFWCHFGFNGKEKDNETYGDGNEYDYGARIYSPRLKWLSVDRLTSKYPDLSPYVYAENNPLVMIDNGGDSTAYYSEGGIKLHVSHDNLENAIVVVSDERLFAFQVTLNQNYKKPDAAPLNENLRKMGSVYVLSSMEDFYKSQKAVKEAKIDLDYAPAFNLTELKNSAGKSTPIIPEYSASFNKKGNVFALGQAHTDNFLNKSYPDASLFGDIHSHPDAGNYTAINKYGSLKYSPQSGLSEPDNEHGTYNGGFKGAFKGMIDKNSITLYRTLTDHNGKSLGQTTVKFDRNERFKK